MKQTMEEGVSGVLCSMVQDMTVSSDSGAHILQELLSSPWLSALLQTYESLLQFRRLRPAPMLPYSSALSHEIRCLMAKNSKLQRPSAEARELFHLLSSAHVKALLRSHDSVAQEDFGPVLEPLPDDLDEDEEAVRIVCLVKNNQPLWGRRRAWSPDTVARLLPAPPSDWCTCLNQSAPSVFSPAPCSERRQRSDSTDEYSFPPPPVPFYSLSLPNSPALCKKTSSYGLQYRRQPSPSSTTTSLPCSPAIQRYLPPPGGSTQPLSYLPAPVQASPNVYCKVPQPQTKRINQRRPVLSKQRSIDELRSMVQNVASTFANEDVHHLGHKMAAATELMTDSVEENAQALDLLVEVVDKLQGLIVASKSQTSSPQNRQKLKLTTPPLTPRRLSSPSPKVLRKVPRRRPLSSSSSSSSSCSTSSASLHFCPDAYKPSRKDPKKCVTFGGGGDGQGATIKRDEKSGEIFIARVIHGGLADRSGLLHAGDHLLEVNGSAVSGLEPEKIIQILVNSCGTLVFKVVPNGSQSISSQRRVFMRAMVDYCPHQDSSIPCAAAGVGFSRADVLEVVDQTDGQWWQARRLPSSGASRGLMPSSGASRGLMPSSGACAGLIPSASNLKSKQRAQWWCQPLQTHTCIKPLSLGNNDGDEAEIKDQNCSTDGVDPDETGKVHIAGFRRSFRASRSLRLRRQSCSSCCHGNSALATPYEEVTLYQRPLQDAHRLILLVGASAVGVSELRKRLIQTNPLVLRGPVPHTTRPIRAEEQTGREYHFVSRETFDHMTTENRFVEQGEHRGHLYGTSFEEVEEVLLQGRVCVLDVEPRMIQSLRNKTLRPFVVFIKVPEPTRLRQTRREAWILTKDGHQRRFMEEDFVEMEQTSKVMEAKYRQLFDCVLVNRDLHESCLQLCSMVQRAQDQEHWVPVSWTREDL